MDLLLDAHTLLLALSDAERLGADARSALLRPDATRWVSVVSLWELAIKTSLGKLTLSRPLRALVLDELPRQGVLILGVSAEHVLEVQGLAFHHRDPFDRLIVAQARVAGLAVVSADAALDAYGIHRIW